MKKKLKILAVIALFLVTGCGNTSLKEYSENMSFKKIDSYILDLRINGEYKNRNVNEVIRIYNFKNEQLRITSSPDLDKIYPSTGEDKFQSKMIIFEKGKVYKETSDYKYIETDASIIYKETDIYTKSIESLEKASKKTKEKLGEKEYDVYEVEFKKETAEKILETTNYKDLKVTNKVIGKVYIEGENIYRIDMEIETLKISANFFGINTVRKTEIRK